MDKSVLELLKNADWDRICAELLKYALYKVGRRYFRQNSPINGLLKEDLAEEVVQRAIYKVMEGVRKWNPDEKDDLLIFLKSVVKSEVSHLDDDEESQITDRFKTVQDGHDVIEVEELQRKGNPRNRHTIEQRPSDVVTPESQLIEKEREQCDCLAQQAILDLVKGQPDLEDVILCIMEDIYTPREIAAELGVDVKEIYNRKKKLQRLYSDLYKRAEKGDL